MSQRQAPIRNRILHLGKYFAPHRGGMETVLLDMMNLQTRAGHTVGAVVHSTPAQLIDTLTTTYEGYRVRRSGRWFTAVFAPIAPFFWWSVLKEIQHLKPDVIHIHMPNLSAFWLLLLPAARRIPWIVHWHSDVLASKHSKGLRFFYRLYRPLELLLLSRAQEIVATSPPYLDTSIPLRPFRNKCSVQPLQLDVSRIPDGYRTAPQPPKRPDETIRVLCVGRLTYYKDFGTAIKAVAEIPGAQLHIVGSGEEESVLNALVKTLGIGDRVKLLGAMSDEDLWKQYTWCDVLCLPSVERTEAFGVVILEASAFGKPSLVADTEGSGMSWVIGQVTPRGYTFEAQNYQDARAKLVCMVSSQGRSGMDRIHK